MSPAADRVIQSKMAVVQLPQSDIIANTPWGSIVIYNGDNYREFADSCMLALIGAGAFDIVLGFEPEIPKPALNTGEAWECYTSWQKRRGTAVQIISSGVNAVQRSKLL